MSHGSFVWYDVMTTDQKASEAFYARVVGWDMKPYPGPNPYTVANLPGDERGVAGVMPAPEGAPPMWSGYIAVDDVDASAEQVKAAGGVVHKGPWDVPEVGRMAVASDPQGAMFMLFKPHGPDMPPIDKERVGVIGWRELMTTDWKAAFDFYSKVFGWTVDHDFDMGEHGVYRVFRTGGDEPAGGMMNKMPQSPTAWGFYFRVDGVEAGAERIKHAGGQVVMGPMEVPDGQFVAVGVDPQGAAFGLLSRTK